MLRNKLSRNKRGEDMIIDFWAILIFALIIIVFFIIFSAEKRNFTAKIETEFANKDTDFMLDSFLRAPLLDNPQKTVSDVIVEDSASGNYENTKTLLYAYFRRTTKINSHDVNDILLDIEGPLHSKSIKMVAEGGVGFGKAFALSQIGGYIHNNYAETYIPSYDGKIHVVLRLAETVVPGEPAENTKAAASTNTQSDTNTPTIDPSVPGWGT